MEILIFLLFFELFLIFRDHYHENLVFQLPTKWSEAFKFLEIIKTQNNIEDCSLKPVDLNEIFYRVTKR